MPTLLPAPPQPGSRREWTRRSAEAADRDPDWALGQRLYPDYHPVYDPTLGPDDPEYYPCHPEIAVVENVEHARLINYMDAVLTEACPDRGVYSRLAVHRIYGNREIFLAPDLLVTARPPTRTRVSSYLTFSDPPILLVGEVVSASNDQVEMEKKLRDYQDELAVPEYLLVDPVKGILVLHRLANQVYTIVPAEADGRVWSEQCRVWFQWDPAGRLRIYGEDGVERLHYAAERARAEEEHKRAEQAAARAQEEHKRAEQAAAREEEARSRVQEAVARAAAERDRAEQADAREEEARSRVQEAVARAEAERDRAEQADARAQRLAARLRELGLDPDG